MIDRQVLKTIIKRIKGPKALVLFGARQVGKSTLLKQIETHFTKPILKLNGDEADVRNLFTELTSTKLNAIIGQNKTLLIDEAQRINDIGLGIKLITDNRKDVKVIATGSSSFDLANKLNEPLTGRKWEFKLYPLSYSEMVNHHGLLTERRMLENRLIYGYYPEIVTSQGDEIVLLKTLVDSYLYKDVLVLEKILKPEKLQRLVKALAFQIGSQVSYHELGKTCGLDNQTVERYIDVLEKAFVIFRLSSFSRNLRNELKQSRKIYFYDLGVRNTIINNFNQLEFRNDVGALWENFIIMERIKHLHYNEKQANIYFWRNTDQQEIDYIEEADGKLMPYEFKWKTNNKTKFPKSFIQAYEAEGQIITPENFEAFIL